MLDEPHIKAGGEEVFKDTALTGLVPRSALAPTSAAAQGHQQGGMAGQGSKK